jgi:hypothetical protein
MSRWIFLCVGLVLTSTTARAQNAAIDRGKKALETRAFNGTRWTVAGYEKAWEYWTPRPKKKPDNYHQAFREYYGLPEAPFENDGYPLGMRKGPDGEGVATDCMICHGGSIFGKSYMGLGNSTLDLQALAEDMGRASELDEKKYKFPFPFANVRGTNEALGFAEILLSMRDEKLGPLEKPPPWKINGQLCEDVPAWWHLHRKQTMYRTGSTDAHSVRALMQFMLSGNPLENFEKEEPVFRDIQAYLLSLRPPQYPVKELGPINQKLADQGEKPFRENCAHCHGTYGPNGNYPNKIVPHKDIGTDTARSPGVSDDFIMLYNKSWFAKEKPNGFKFAEKSTGYQAPPLDGIWATAPYFHNGSAPTVYHVLNSKDRPKYFKRSYRTEKEDYDPVNLGWKFTELNGPADPTLPAIEQRKVYDTTKRGRGSGGHTFGDDLTEKERMAVIEYLKTL